MFFIFLKIKLRQKINSNYFNFFINRFNYWIKQRISKKILWSIYKPIIEMQSVEKIINNTVYGANFDGDKNLPIK